MIDFNKIPDELKFNGVWCVWKDNKLPYNPRTNQLAKSNDKTTFASFKVALNVLHNYKGLGLGIFNDFCAIDIDHCIDENGIPNDMAKDIIDYMQSYTEISPSGKGIRIIFKTDCKINKSTHYIKNSKIGLEIYISDNTNRYVTITGNTYQAFDINKIDITYILDKYMLKEKDFIKNDKKLNELWNSIAPGSGANESEMDLALLSKLRFYYKDNYLTKFKESPYYKSKDDYHLKKFEREDYLQGLVDKLDGNPTYNPVFASDKNFELNDTGNACRFRNKFGDLIKYNYDNKMWMIWNGKYWQFDVCDQIKNLVEILIEEMRLEAVETQNKDKINNAKRAANKSGKDALLSECKHLVPITNNQLDNYKYLINCNNGILNLKTLELMNHDKEYLLSNFTDVNYIKNAKPKKFIKFLKEIFCDNEEKIAFIRKLFAYCLTGETKDQAFIIFYGEGSNGKSVLIDLIQHIMGEYCTTANKDLLLDKKFQTQAMSEVARLKGMRCIFVSETESGDKLKESFVKDITGGNSITARFLYANEFTFYPEFTPILVTNHLPIINSMDKAMLRRLYPVDFSRIFSVKEQNINLLDELLEEKDLIFSWIVEDSWYKGRLVRYQFIEDNLNAYKKEMDIVDKWIDESCVKEGQELSAKLFKSFNQYCKDNKLFEMNSVMFGRNMGNKFNKIRNGKGIFYDGISLR